LPDDFPPSSGIFVAPLKMALSMLAPGWAGGSWILVFGFMRMGAHSLVISLWLSSA